MYNIGFGHRIWAGLFSNSSEIIDKFASLTPLLLIALALDSLQGVLSGVARGCGWQRFAMCINLAMFYLIGMPIAAVLAFKVKLYAKGLLMGLICGLSCQAFVACISEKMDQNRSPGKQRSSYRIRCLRKISGEIKVEKDEIFVKFSDS